MHAVASEVTVNEHCLLTSEADARMLLQSGRLEHAEPGPYRIFAVYLAAAASVCWRLQQVPTRAS